MDPLDSIQCFLEKLQLDRMERDLGFRIKGRAKARIEALSSRNWFEASYHPGQSSLR